MGYQEEKDKYDLIFHRELSDREFAEAMYEKWREMEEYYRELEDEHDALLNDYARAREELAKPHIEEKWQNMCMKIQDILSAPAEEHQITIHIINDTYRIDCRLSGMYEEKETLSE